MLKKLYNSGYFNYEKFIIENLKKLSLSPDEAIVLTKLLYYAKKEQKAIYDILSTELTLKTSELENVLNNLLERGFYNTYLVTTNGVAEEKISLDGFFERAEEIVDYSDVSLDDELHSVISYLKSRMNRQLTSTELDIVSSFVRDDYYKLDDFKVACDKVLKKRKTISIKALSTELASKEKVKNEEAKETPDFVKDFIKNLK
ncbi:MAG: hypothetical protein IJU60_04255 [Acholeplasmatales bacterium]|nr:hypothetical protein [Acholeplasmatales bacterium]